MARPVVGLAVAAARPDAYLVVMEDRQPIAIDLIPEAFAGHLLDFLCDTR